MAGLRKSLVGIGVNSIDSIDEQIEMIEPLPWKTKRGDAKV